MSRLFGALLAVLLLTVVVPPSAPNAAAQGTLSTISVWTLNGVNSSLPDPKIWNFATSVEVGDLGSATVADPAFDDTAWGTRNVVNPRVTGITNPEWRSIPGPGVANYFRKEFDLADLGYEAFEVVAIDIALQYDDGAVVYLNGEEVYRSIRGNIDPLYATYPAGADLPADAFIAHGGYEGAQLSEYVKVPDPDLTNTCEWPTQEPNDCMTIVNDPVNGTQSPYGSAHPPAVPVSLLNDGVNVWSATVWNQSGGGSGDISFDMTFSITVDDAAIAPTTVTFNEVMASNQTTLSVDADNDGDLDTPDWFELYNSDNEDVDLGGWTVSDAGRSFEFAPGTIVPAEGYLLVLAAGDETPPASPLQTNFALSSGGDSLTLTRFDNVVSDSVSWTDQFADNSMGRVGQQGDFVYLESPTVQAPATGLPNTVGPLVQAPPILRTFRDRMYNPGEPVGLQVKGFDPDGDPLTYSLTPLPAGVSIDSATGAITGTADWTGTISSQLRITDGDNDFAEATVDFIMVDAVVGPPPIVLNEYNAVPSEGELGGGSPIGNGGDWFEFLVLEDELNLAGYTIEFRQRDSGTDQLRFQTILTFGLEWESRRVPAGTIITIGEEQLDDLSFDGVDDWHLHLQVDNFAVGDWFEFPPPGSIFNSTRRDQTVLIRNDKGQVVTPLTGETDGWDAANGGVGASEVFNLCASAVQGSAVNPITDYIDNADNASFGLPNVCVFTDPATQQIVTQTQDLSALRSSATFGVGGGDATCDGKVDIDDAIAIVRHVTLELADTGPCLLNNGGPGHEIFAAGADVDGEIGTSIGDAIAIVQCVVGNSNVFCPPE